MSVLKEKRQETPFTVRINALDMRQKITEYSFRRFGKKPRTMPKQPSNWEKWSDKSREDWTRKEEEKLANAEKFDDWFITNERTIIDRMLRRILFDIDKANIMRPVTVAECDKQRELMDDAIGTCSNLIHELQYIAETIPSNKNFVIKTVELIEKELRLLRGWRKSTNANREKVMGGAMEIEKGSL